MSYPNSGVSYPEQLQLNEDIPPTLHPDGLVEAQYTDGTTHSVATRVYGNSDEDAETVLWYPGIHERSEYPLPFRVLRDLAISGIRCIVVSPPGHVEDSDNDQHSVAYYAGNTQAVMAAYKLEHAHAGGRSTGVAHALADAVLFGNRIKSLTLASSVVPLEEGAANPYDALEGSTDDFKRNDTPISDQRSVVEPEISRMLARPKEVNSRRLRSYLAMLSLPWGFRPESVGEGTPTVIIHGEDDTIFPYLNAYQLKEAIPHSLVQVYGDMGHLGTMGHPMLEALRTAIGMTTSQ